MSEHTVIEFDDPCLDQLERCLSLPPVENMNGNEVFLLTEQVVFSFRIFAGEHAPPHFHVCHGEEENTFRLDNGVPLHPHNGLRKHFGSIKQWYDEHREKLIDAWNQNRPSNCPVGKIL